MCKQRFKEHTSTVKKEYDLLSSSFFPSFTLFMLYFIIYLCLLKKGERQSQSVTKQSEIQRENISAGWKITINSVVQMFTQGYFSQLIHDRVVS